MSSTLKARIAVLALLLLGFIWLGDLLGTTIPDWAGRVLLTMLLGLALFWVLPAAEHPQSKVELPQPEGNDK